MSEGERSSKRLILPSICLSFFATMLAGLLMGLLLIDIALAFECPIGIMGQVSTVSSIAAVVFALLMGALALRFKHKSLLMTGLLLYSVSALCCYLAPNYNMFLISYAVSGIGGTMVVPMCTALIADHLPQEKRTRAFGWLWAVAALSYIIGAPLIGFVASFGGWRLPLIAFVMPTSLLSLSLVAKGLPSTSRSQQLAMSKMSFFEGFRGILSNRSAVSCLVGNALITAAFQVTLYAASFFRQRFQVSTDFVSIIYLGAASFYTLGSLVSDRFVKRLGRKPLRMLNAIVVGTSIILFTNLPNLWLTLSLLFLFDIFSGMAAPAASSLTIEQVPKFRGAMMSIDSAATSMGLALGAAVGGFVLLFSDYGFVGISLGAMDFAAALVTYALVIDPTRTNAHDRGS